MLKRIFQAVSRSLSQQDSPKETLSAILHSPTAREELLGVARMTPPSPEQILQDVNHVLSYSRTEDYRVWSQEVWAKVIGHMDKLLDPKSSRETVDFERGALSASLAILRVSYLARLHEERMKKQAEATPRTARK